MLTLLPLSLSLVLPGCVLHPAVASSRMVASPRMMFGGGGGDKGGEAGFMDKLKQAQDMFNPEMMKCALAACVPLRLSRDMIHADLSSQYSPQSCHVTVHRAATPCTCSLAYPPSVPCRKYAQVGERVQQLQVELAQTEVECATKDGGVTVKVSGTQVPLSVAVSSELCGTGVENVSAELTKALKQAHSKSGNYAQDKMKGVYEELGLAPGMGGQ